jgi:hypothetical protein
MRVLSCSNCSFTSSNCLHHFQITLATPDLCQYILKLGRPLSLSQRTTHKTTTIMPNEPFRLLDLPAELRLMVYENVKTTVNRITFTHSPLDPDDQDGAKASSIILTIKSLPVALLRTSRFIHQEAKATMSTKILQLEQEPVRVETDIGTLIVIGEKWSWRTNMDISKICRSTGASRLAAGHTCDTPLVTRRTLS